MSAGHATKLSYRDDLGGQLGDPELSDSPTSVEQKLAQLCTWVTASKKIVAFTGAGISTACGIPDFRGPSGIWTLQRAGKPIPKFKVSFGTAKPSLTHQALLALLQAGKLQYVVSQNVDSLHLRSGIPRSQLAELHGNCFAERCSKCNTEYIRDFEMETVGFKYTKRRCVKDGCNGRLRDHVLDWEDALPEDELNASEQAAAEADLAICLGTSLQITPACNIPLKTLKAGGKLVIINLQKTPKDKKANLVIHARCDDIMQQLMTRLDLPIPAYIRQDAVVVSHTIAPAKTGCSDAFSCNLSVQSIHGVSCPMPLVKGVDIKFEGSSARAAKMQKQPFSLTRTFQSSASVVANITIHLATGLDITQHIISHGIDSAATPSTAALCQTYQFTTQEQCYATPSSEAGTAAEPTVTVGSEISGARLPKRMRSC